MSVTNAPGTLEMDTASEYPEMEFNRRPRTSERTHAPRETEEQYDEPDFCRERITEIVCPVKCAHPKTDLTGSPRSKDSCYFHAVTLPCSVKNIWAYIRSCAQNLNDIEKIYKSLRAKHHLPPRPCFSTILARITEDLLDPHFVLPVSELALSRLLTTEVTGLPYESGKGKKDLNVPLHLSVCRQIAEVMENERGTPGMLKYRKLTEILATPECWHSWFIQDAISARSGPVTDLAASVTVENINYWMNLFKVSASTDFLHRIFGCPSVTGKCVALIELLEIHGILWQSISAEHVQNLVSLLYNLIKFIMETCKMAGHYAVQGFEWVGAKFKRSANETNQFPDLEPQLPETEEQYLQNPNPPVHQVGLPCAFSENWTSTVLKDSVDALVRMWKSENDLQQAACDADVMPSLHSVEQSEGFVTATAPTEVTWRNTTTECDSIRTDPNIAQTLSKIQMEESKNALLRAAPYQTFIDKIKVELERDPNSGDIYEIQKNISEMVLCSNLTAEEMATCHEILDIINKAKMTKVRDWVQTVEAYPESGVKYPPPSKPLQKTTSCPLLADIQESVRQLARARSVQDGSMSYDEAAAHIARQLSPGSFSPMLQAKLEGLKSGEEVKGVLELIKNLEFSELGRRFLAWLKRTFADVYKFFLDCPLVGAIIGVVFSVLSFLGFTVSEFKTAGDKKTFFQKVSSSMRDVYYCQRGRDAIFSSFSHFVEVASDMLDLNKDHDVEEFKMTLEALQVEMNKTVLEASTSPGKFVNDSKKFKEFTEVMEAVQAQYKMLISMNPKVNMAYLAPVWNQILSSYNKLQNIWCKYLASGGLRQEPVCVWLYGPTMLGKSSYAQWMVDKLNELQGTEWQMFTISKGPEFWNGYSQQEIVLIDDFASYIGPEGCLDALAVMNLCSCAAYNPNMAALEDKVIQARPKVVIVCSNHPTIPLNTGITDMVAFERRRDLFIEVTWPEHENCGATTACEHFKNKNQNNFDHLCFSVKNPIVSVAHSAPSAKARISRGQRTDGIVYTQREPKTINSISPMEIVETVVQKIEEKKVNYETQLARRERKNEPTHQAEGEFDIAFWEKNCNIVLSGPGGTGKSTLFDKLVQEWTTDEDQERKPRRVKRINTIEEFEAFAAERFEDSKYDVIVFDDTSTFHDSQFFKLFLKTWKSRYDVGDETSSLWLIGMNEEIFKAAVEKEHDSTYFDIIMRRADVYHTAFRYKPGIAGIFGRRYTHRDVASIRNSKKKINEVVQYTKEGCDTHYTAEGLRVLIRDHKHCKSTEKIITRLPIRKDFEPQISVKLDMTSDEFMESFINTPGSIARAVRLLTGEKCEYRTANLEVTKMDIGQKILMAYRQSRELVGCTFTCMYDFVLEAYINDLFDTFKGLDCALEFLDVTYFIATVNGKVEAGIFEPDDLVAYRIALEANTIKEEVSGIDMAAAVMTNLPPWFCLASQCVASVVKMGATFFACSQVTAQNKILFDALKRAGEIQTKTSEYVEKADRAFIDNYSDTLDNQLQMVRPQAPVYPKQPARSATVCHGTIADQDHFAHKEILSPFPQDYTPEAKKSMSRAAKMLLRKPGKQAIELQCQGIDPAELEPTIVANLRKPECQALIDASLPACIGAIIKNCVTITTVDGRKLCHGLMINGHVGTTVQHICASSSAFKIVDYKGNSWPISISVSDPSRDRMDFKVVDNRCPRFKNIMNHITDKNHAPIEDKPVVLVTFSDWIKGTPTVLIRSYTVQAHTMYVTAESSQEVPGYVYVGTKSGFQLPNVNTFAGDCGSILMVVDPLWSRKIIGIHAAATPQMAYAREVYVEDYMSLTNPTQQAITIPYEKPEVGYFGKFSEFMAPKEACDRERRPLLAISTCKQFTPATTRLWLSPMPFGPRMFEPSLLSPHDTRNPSPMFDFMAAETFKWMRERPQFSEEEIKEMDLVFECIGDYFAQVMKARKVKLGVLSKTAAVNKLSGMQHSRPVQLGSSAGYPWNAMVDSGKKKFIDMDPKTGVRFIAHNEYGQALHNAIDDLKNDARMGKESFTVFKICLKDELVKLKKIYQEPKTRTIAAAPLHLVIALRQYYHAGHAAIAECWDELPPKIGISANSLDWHALFMGLAKKSTLAFDFDYKGWDFSVPPEFLERVPRVYNAMYRLCDKDWCPLDDTIRENLYLSNVCRFKFLYMSRVYQSTGGMPSGHPGTAVDNSIVNLAYMFFVWRKLAPPDVRGFKDFLFDCGVAIYGDDILVTASPFALKFFNGITVSEQLTKMGLEVTSPVKEEPIVESRPLEDCEFMSRGFSRMFGFWVGPLREPQVLKCTHFVAGPKSHYYWKEQNVVYFDAELYRDVADGCLREMFLHGREKYDKLREHFIVSFSDLGCPAYFPNYTERIEEFFSINPQSLQPGPDPFPIEAIHLQRLSCVSLPERSEPEWRHFHNRSSLSLGVSYKYTGNDKPCRPMEGKISRLCQDVNERLNKKFNSCLVNVYDRGGLIPWHKDDEKGLDLQQGVFCYTVSGGGVLQLMKPNDHLNVISHPLKPGDCYLLERDYLTAFLHRRINHREPTISLTFRRLRVPGE
nr:MAG: RNA-dependent RNA polymerase [Riboviria sp.]